jgi:EAL domain-containing protein (putative c-di-GMP-specific phosphodiesterase class I)
MDKDDPVTSSGSARPLSHHDQLALLRNALDADGLVVCGQPIVDLATGDTVAHELTLRLPARDGNLISSDGLHSLAERFGLVAELDDLLIRRAAGLAAGGDAVALDIHAGSIADPGLACRTEQALADAGALPGLMTFELSERGLTTNAPAASAFIHRMHQLGCRITADAFGLGSAGFNYLKRLRLDHLKIDTYFVEGLQTAPSDDQFVRAFVHLAQGLRIRTAADGVVDATTRGVLADAGIDQAQGPLFGGSAPLPAGGLAMPRPVRGACPAL